MLDMGSIDYYLQISLGGRLSKERGRRSIYFGQQLCIWHGRIMYIIQQSCKDISIQFFFVLLLQLFLILLDFVYVPSFFQQDYLDK